MKNNKKLKLAAIKLSTLKLKDCSWVLSQLPDDIVAEISLFLDELDRFNLENTSSLLSHLEQELEQAQLCDEELALCQKALSMPDSTCIALYKAQLVLENTNFINIFDMHTDNKYSAIDIVSNPNVMSQKCALSIVSSIKGIYIK